MGFEEWFKTYGNLQCDKDACEDAFEAGQKSKQAEVDALKAKIDVLEKWADAKLRTELAKHEPLDLEPADIPHGTIVIDK